MPSTTKIFLTLFLAVFVTTTGSGLVAPLLPVYAHELGAGAFQVGLIFSAFSITRTLFVPYFGKLSDRKGKKPLLSSGLFLYFLLSLLYPFSGDITALILLRLGQGFASAMILPVAHAYVGMITPRNKEGLLMGLFNISLYGGLSLGPILGGVANDWFNIYVPFLSMGTLAFIGFLLCFVFLPSERHSAGSSTRKGEEGISYLALLRIPAVFSIFAFRACFTVCIGIMWSFLPLLASTKLGLSSSAIGLVIMINVSIAGLFQAPMGFLADRFNKTVMVVTGGVLAFGSVLYMNTATSVASLALTNGLIGLGGGISLPAIMAVGVIEGRRTRSMGSVMGLLALGHSLGMLVGPLLGGVVIDLFSFGTMFTVGAMVLGAGTVLYMRNFL